MVTTTGHPSSRVPVAAISTGSGVGTPTAADMDAVHVYVCVDSNNVQFSYVSS